MKNLYIADLHFGHARVIEFDQRPFTDVEQMEEELIRRWNSVVNPGDTVYILGDFCWRVEDEWLRLLHKLKGNKVLLKGNHDLKRLSDKVKKEFQDIKEIKVIKDGPYSVVMSHYPIMFYPHDHHEETIMLCGHVHNTIENDYLVKWREELQRDRHERPGNCGNIINVGCMMPYMDYTPRTLVEILEGVPLWKSNNEENPRIED